MVGVEHDGRQVPGNVPGKADRGARDRRLTPDARDQQAQDDEQLGQPDGGDGEDEAGRAPEAPHDEDLHDGREQYGGDQAGGEPEEVVHAREADEAHGQDRRRGAEVALGEVDDLVEPVGEAEPDRHERPQQAEDQALHPHAEGDGEERELQHQDRGDRGHPRDRRSAPPRQHGPGGQRLPALLMAIGPPRVARWCGSGYPSDPSEPRKRLLVSHLGGRTEWDRPTHRSPRRIEAA